MKNVNFVISKSPNMRAQNAPIIGSTSVVQKTKIGGRDFVIKTPNTQNHIFENMDEWLNKMKMAKEITNIIRNINNTKYYVPKTFISHGKVLEEYIDGIQLSKITHDTIDRETLNFFLTAVADLKNDMSELYPIKNNPDFGKKLFGMPPAGLDKLLYWFSENNPNTALFNDKFFMKMKEIFNYFLYHPDNKKMVFHHKDLDMQNIIIDIENKRTCIIDFEQFGFETMLEAMGKFPLFPETYDYLNKLPKKINSGLFWNYNIDNIHLFNTYRLLIEVMFKFYNCIRYAMKEKSENLRMQKIIVAVSDLEKECANLSYSTLEKLYVKALISNKINQSHKAKYLSSSKSR